MARMAAGRDTHLTRGEIAQEALRQFDEGPREPSIRSLAAALHVTPMAIYHHFPSQEAVYQAVVEAVWGQTFANLLELVPRPLHADPADVLVAVGLATRRTWLEHYRVARYLAATPQENDYTANSMGLFAKLFERLGLEGADAAAAFHAYATFMFGSVMFATSRLDANRRLRSGASSGDDRPEARRRSRRKTPPTPVSIEQIVELSVVDPAHDDQLYEQGLRHLIASYTPPRRRRTKSAPKPAD
jgi:AcrR family transcriptional regulator